MLRGSTKRSNTHIGSSQSTEPRTQTKDHKFNRAVWALGSGFSILRQLSTWVCVLGSVIWALFFAPRVWAYSLLPLATEDPVPIPSGITQVSLGLTYTRNGTFPFFTPADSLDYQNLLEVPQLAIRVGAGDWVEILAIYELIYLDERMVNGDTTNNYGSGDARIFTKVRLLQEGQTLPAFSLRFGAKLPNANGEKHLGTDETDFAGEILASKQFGPVNLLTNFGLVLMGVPPNASDDTSEGQDDLVSYSVAAVWPWQDHAESDRIRLALLGEVAGLAGSRFGNDRAAIRIGLQGTQGAGTIYLGISTGLISESEQIGVNAGFTYTFDLATWFQQSTEPRQSPD